MLNNVLPADLAGSSEPVEIIEIESPDYTDYELLSPGTYASPNRTVKVEKRTDKNGNPFIMARLEFAYLTNEEGQGVALRRPIVKYIFSFTRKQKGHQGETSDIAKYLGAAGVDLGGKVNSDVLTGALAESAGLPVRVRIDWTNRTPKNEATGAYLPEKAYTSDFRKGANGSATYVAKLTADDVAELPEKAQTRLSEVFVNGFIQAKHRVGDFYRV